MNQIVLLILFFLMGSSTAHAFPSLGTYQADQAFEQGDFQAAEQKYLGVIKKSPQNYKAQYNLGDAYYRNQKYAEAESRFRAALQTADSALREKTLYNLGNTLFRQDRLEEALDLYNKALEMAPKNEKAQANRDYVQKLLEKKKQEDQKQDPNQDQKKKEDQKQEDQKKEQDQKQQQQQQNQDQNPDQKQDQKQNGEQKKDPQSGEDQNKKEGQDQQQQKASQKEIDKWLKTVEDDSQGSLKKMWEMQTGRPRKVEKDW